MAEDSKTTSGSSPEHAFDVSLDVHDQEDVSVAMDDIYVTHDPSSSAEQLAHEPSPSADRMYTPDPTSVSDHMIYNPPPDAGDQLYTAEQTFGFAPLHALPPPCPGSLTGSSGADSGVKCAMYSHEEVGMMIEERVAPLEHKVHLLFGQLAELVSVLKHSKHQSTSCRDCGQDMFHGRVPERSSSQDVCRRACNVRHGCHGCYNNNEQRRGSECTTGDYNRTNVCHNDPVTSTSGNCTSTSDTYCCSRPLDDRLSKPTTQNTKKSELRKETTVEPVDISTDNIEKGSVLTGGSKLDEHRERGNRLHDTRSATLPIRYQRKTHLDCDTYTIARYEPHKDMNTIEIQHGNNKTVDTNSTPSSMADTPKTESQVHRALATLTLPTKQVGSYYGNMPPCTSNSMHHDSAGLSHLKDNQEHADTLFTHTINKEELQEVEMESIVDRNTCNDKESERQQIRGVAQIKLHNGHCKNTDKRGLTISSVPSEQTDMNHTDGNQDFAKMLQDDKRVDSAKHATTTEVTSVTDRPMVSEGTVAPAEFMRCPLCRMLLVLDIRAVGGDLQDVCAMGEGLMAQVAGCTSPVGKQCMLWKELMKTINLLRTERATRAVHAISAYLENTHTHLSRQIIKQFEDNGHRLKCTCAIFI